MSPSGTSSRASRKAVKAAGRRPLSRFEQLEARAMLAADPWQNATNHLDVLNKGAITPADALAIINDLNLNGSHALTPLASDFAVAGPAGVAAASVATASVATSTMFEDVNGDGMVTPADALDVINALNANDQIQVTMVATDMNGVPIASAAVGSTFQIEALVSDISGNATAAVGTTAATGGVFSAYLNAAYNGALASIDPNATVAYGSNFANGQTSNLSTAGQIVGTGAFAAFTAPGPGQFELWSIPVTATAVGTETFTPGASTTSNNEFDLYGVNGAIPSSEVNFVSGSVSIIAATAPQISISPATVTRPTSGPAIESFIVTLANPSNSQAATVQFATADGTAVAGTDYMTTDGTLTFPAGVTTENITVPVIGSTAYNPSSQFTLNLSNPVNASIGTEQATGTITSSNPKPKLAISTPAAVTRPSSGTVNDVFTVTLTGPTELSTEVNYATANGTTAGSEAMAGTDYTSTSGQLVFPPGTTSENITVPILGNTTTTGSVSFTLNLKTPTNGTVTTSVGTGTIVAATAGTTADLLITKSDNKGGSSPSTIGNVTPGSQLTYTIVVTNNGPNTAAGTTVADTMPSGITSDTWTAATSTGATGFTPSSSGSIDDTAVSLPSGSSVTYTVTANVSASATGSLSNTATVTAGAGVTDPNLANNSATDTDNVVQMTDLSITKTDNTSSVVPGTATTYTIVVTNSGPSAANGVQVADTLPAGIVSDTWTATATGGATGFPASGSGAINNSAVDMPVSSTVTYTVIANISPSATGTLSNTATVTPPAGITDTNNANNSATDTDTLTPTVDLKITKVDNKGGSSITPTTGNVTPGNPLTYTIVVSNSGPSTATGSKVADTLPASITSDTWTAVPAGGATGFTASGSGAINDTGVNLPSGSTVTYTVVANVSGSASGTLSNTATVTAAAGTTDSNPANNSATDTDNLVPTADLSITKVDNKGGSSITNTTGAASPGGTIVYTIVVTNAGPLTATGATVADTLPAGISSDSYTATPSGGATGFTPSGTGAIDDTAVNLPSGSTVTYVVTAAINPSASGSLSNTATVTAPGGLTDPNLANNSATDNDSLVPMTDLAVTKVDNVGGSSITNTTGLAANDGTIIYTIVVTNNGPASATGAKVVDTLPAAFSSDSYTATPSGGATGFTPSGTGAINDTALNMPSGSSVTYIVTAQLAASFAGSVQNTATVTAPAADTDPNTANNSATDTDTVPGVADLTITKTDNKGGSSITSSSGTAIPGQAVVYTIVVTNNGPSNVTGATIADTLPSAEFASDSFTATPTGGAAGFTASGSGSIDDTAVNMPVGSTVTYTVTANVNPAATGTLANTATASVPAGYTDPLPGNNSATDNDALTPMADLSITKVDNQGGSSITDTTGSVVKGTSFTYTIVVTNNGPSAASGASVVDSLPAAITSDTFTATATGGASGFTASGTGNIDDTAVNLPNGSKVTYTVVAALSSSAISGPMTNTATVTAPVGVVDTNSANNSAADTDNVVVYTVSSLSGTEFIDSNGNGTFDSGELKVENATIQLTGTNVLNAAVSETTTTAADGTYSFTNLTPGTYTITSVQSPYLSASNAIVGSEGGTASDANDIKLTIGPAGGITGTGNNFTETGISSVAISERALLASNQLSGTLNLSDTSIFPAATPAVATPAVAMPSAVPASTVAASSTSASTVDAAFADANLTQDPVTSSQLGFATASQAPSKTASAVDQVIGQSGSWLLA